MLICNKLSEAKQLLGDKGTAVALGTFDGVHIGHQSIIQRAMNLAKAHKLVSVVYTFSNHPLEQIAPDKVPMQIGDNISKADILKAMGVQMLVNVAFNEKLCRQSPETFIDELCRSLNPHYLVTGPNFSFGAKAKGNPRMLLRMGEEYGFGRMMVNAGKSHSCGIEAALKGQAFDGAFDWGVNYGFTRAVFDEYTDGEGDKAVNYKDKKVPYVPQHTIAAMADYHLGQFTFGLNMNAQGKTYWDNANTYSQKMYFVMGAHCDIDFSKMSISIWGKNLTDTNYNTFAVDNAATGKKLYFAQRGNPFQCGVDLKFHF